MDGYTISIKPGSQSPPGIIGDDGTIVPPESATDVTLVLLVRDNATSVEKEAGPFVVRVPAKSLALGAVDVDVAGGLLLNMTADMQYNLSGGTDGLSGTWSNGAQ